MARRFVMPTRVFAGTCVVGLLVASVGTFLPWFSSGGVERDSYQAAAFADSLALVDNPLLGLLLRAWIGVPSLSAVCVALFALGLLRVAAVTTLPLATLVGTVSVVAIVQAAGSAGAVSVTATGPATTTTGMTTAMLSAVGVLVSYWGKRDRRCAETGRAGV
ncbi:hypothetical protein FHU38_002577 [Saccharomonospora amisosensis]|uniref:Uncharacterized protein n=1 Tax=Saccharomonospora amisosensis TaxID=1128677 RepID=A0A7X5ZQV0_9PSEU|nr:hypothetical protein [Saccharomonospora amisosensis]NIJ12233.1 hypothetical protein [Saccharomonospora amisosensis]